MPAVAAKNVAALVDTENVRHCRRKIRLSAVDCNRRWAQRFCRKNDKICVSGTAAVNEQEETFFVDKVDEKRKGNRKLSLAGERSRSALLSKRGERVKTVLKRRCCNQRICCFRRYDRRKRRVKKRKMRIRFNNLLTNFAVP